MERLRSCIKRFAALSAVAMLGMALAPATRADTIVFNPTGGAATVGGFNPGNLTVTSLNFGTGDAVAIGAIANSGIVAPGSTFQLYFQGNISSVTLANGGGSFTPAGLNQPTTGYQITEIASFTEVVTSLSNNAVTFALAPVQSTASGIKMYFQDLAAGAPMTNYNSGTGFSPPPGTGQVIYSANLTSNQSNYTDTTKTGATTGTPPLNPTGTAYAGVTTDQGNGGNNLSMAGVSNPAFFRTPVTFSNFTSNLTNPFLQVQAAAAFNSPNAPQGSAPNILPNPGANNGTSGPDFLLQVSGASQSFSVPEPASISMAVTALAMVPLATWHVRRRRKIA